jgi:hypothetical protein
MNLTAALLHWDGASWTSLFQYPIGDVSSSIFTASPGDVWMLTSGDTAMYWASHLNGGPAGNWAAWPFGSVQSVFGMSTTGIWGATPCDVWLAVGPMAHWDGNTLTRSPGDTWPMMFSVSGSGPHDVWAVGGGGVILHHD